MHFLNMVAKNNLCFEIRIVFVFDVLVVMFVNKIEPTILKRILNFFLFFTEKFWVQNLTDQHQHVEPSIYLVDSFIIYILRTEG